MRFVPLRILCAASALLLLAFAGTTSAQVEAPDDRYAGRYRFDGSAADGRAHVERAIQPILARLNPLLRMAARQRLQEAEPVPRRIDVWMRGARVFVRYVGRDDQRTFDSRAGHPRNVEGETGWHASMTQLFRRGRLEQIFESENGRWYNVFSLDEQGDRLTLRVVVTSARLDDPIQLQLPYVRTR